MGAYLLDTNALVYHYEGDPIGREIDALVRVPVNRIYVSNLTLVEIRSALATRVRNGNLTPEGYQLVVKRFSYDISSLGKFRIEPLRHKFVDPCIHLIETYALRQGLGLRTLDCLHLRVALDLNQREPDLHLVTADRVFAGVARLAGVTPLLLEAPA